MHTVQFSNEMYYYPLPPTAIVICVTSVVMTVAFRHLCWRHLQGELGWRWFKVYYTYICCVFLPSYWICSVSLYFCSLC